jgi:predicted nucleotidyltransferase component of viral defense system
MISQKDLNKLAQKYKINESIVAREFVQISFLKELYAESFSKKIFFKGGTAIRLLFGGQRFSEDLDFTVMLDEKEFLHKITLFFSKLEKLYPFKFKERKTLTGKTFLLSADIPFFKNNVFVKLDFSMRENVLQPTKSILKSDYPVIMQNFIHSLSLDEIFAEKIRAVLKRKKHRDLYDLWILEELGAKMDMELINEKMGYYHETFDAEEFKQRLSIFSKEDFIKDLRPYVPINERDKLGELFEFVLAYIEGSI